MNEFGFSEQGATVERYEHQENAAAQKKAATMRIVAVCSSPLVSRMTCCEWDMSFFNVLESCNNLNFESQNTTFFRQNFDFPKNLGTSSHLVLNWNSSTHVGQGPWLKRQAMSTSTTMHQL